MVGINRLILINFSCSLDDMILPIKILSGLNFWWVISFKIKFSTRLLKELNNEKLLMKKTKEIVSSTNFFPTVCPIIS